MTRNIAGALIVLCWGWLFARVWAGLEFQFDFQTYYLAAQIFERGQTPYDVHQLREASGNRNTLPFIYPLSALHLLRPFAHLDYGSAHRLWVLLKALALVLLFWTWMRWFLREIDGRLMAAVALLGFQAALVWDVKVGNITVFEQLFLWAGFAFLIHRRTTAFVICIVIASIAKLVFVVFLLLLFLPSVRSPANTMRAVAGVVALALLTFLPFAAAPEYLRGFLHAVVSQHPRMQYNPSILGVVDELALFPGTRFLATGWTKLIPVAAYYALLFWVSRTLVRRTLASGSIEQAVLVSAMLYALASPRLVVYSYAIAIVPVLALLLPRTGSTRIGAYALVGAVCLGGLPILPTAVGKFLSDASPLLLLWGACLALTTLEKRAQVA
jgi:hypothetical protein